jgi:Tol biopolymer transport system component
MFDTSTHQLEQLTHAGADSRPVWSPDGTRILFGRATQDTTGDANITVNDASDIYLLDLTKREERRLTDTPDHEDFNFAWSPDGEWIAFASVRTDVNGDGLINLDDSQDLFLIRPDGSEETRLDLEGRPVFSPSWSPDGRFILIRVVVEGGQSELWRYDTVRGNSTRLTEPGPYYHPSYSNSP